MLAIGSHDEDDPCQDGRCRFSFVAVRAAECALLLPQIADLKEKCQVGPSDQAARRRSWERLSQPAEPACCLQPSVVAVDAAMMAASRPISRRA